MIELGIAVSLFSGVFSLVSVIFITKMLLNVGERLDNIETDVRTLQEHVDAISPTDGHKMMMKNLSDRLAEYSNFTSRPTQIRK